MEDVDKAIGKVLIHYGRKGMKWGVITRGRGSEGGGRKERKAAKKEHSEDAARATELHKKAKKSGTQSLSNKELQDLASRMELVGRYEQAAAKNKSKGRQFTDGVLKSMSDDVQKQIGKAIVSGVKTSVELKGDKLLQDMIKKDVMKIPMKSMYGK